MLRATVTLMVTAILTVVIASTLVTIGLLLPQRWCFNPLFQGWSWCVLKLAGVRLTVDGAERITPRRHYFFVGNHQSAIDIPILALCTQGRVRFMAKKSLFQIPFMGWAIWAHGMVPVDRGHARRMKKSIDSLLRRLAKRPASIAVFPEGTRMCDGVVGPFKRGTMSICKRAGMPIVPFAIDGAFRIHRRGIFRIHPGPVRLTFGRLIGAEEIREIEVDELLSRIRGDVMRMLHDPPGLDCDGLAESIVAPCGEKT